MRTDEFTDSREMRFELPSGLPPHLTPAGKRPIQPSWMKITYSITYSITYPLGSPHVWVELYGGKLENDAPSYRRSTVGDTVRRSFSNYTAARYMRDAAQEPVAFDDLRLPEWVRPYVEDNRPPWCPAPRSAQVSAQVSA